MDRKKIIQEIQDYPIVDFSKRAPCEIRGFNPVLPEVTCKKSA
jgi:hypothetical protein